MGAQVLLGFQMRSVFQDEFDALGEHAKAGSGIALVIMVAVLGLLLAPAIQHRVVDNGDASRRILGVIGAAMIAALGLFAFSLAINMFLALERIADLRWAIVGGIAALVLALWFWFGAECLAVMRSGGKDLMMTDTPTPLIKAVDQSAGGTARRPSTAGISTRRGPYARFRDATGSVQSGACASTGPRCPMHDPAYRAGGLP